MGLQGRDIRPKFPQDYRDPWLPDDDAVVTSRDGQVFKGKVADLEMWTGRLVIQLT